MILTLNHPFFGGREATTGNAPAARRLRAPTSRSQEKTPGAKDIGPRVKFIILNIFSESNLYDDLKFPPKIEGGGGVGGGGFYKFRISIKKMIMM